MCLFHGTEYRYDELGVWEVFSYTTNELSVCVTVDRYGHTTTAIGPHLLIFGGWELNKAQNEVIVLRDCESVIPTEQLSKDQSKDQLPSAK